MPLRMSSKWVRISFAIALGVGMFALGCGGEPDGESKVRKYPTTTSQQ